MRQLLFAESVRQSNRKEERAESLRDYLLTEAASDMDELLTPKVKKVFAPLFMDYFDRYADPYLQSKFIPSLSRSQNLAF